MQEDKPLTNYNKWDDPVFMDVLQKTEHRLLSQVSTNFDSSRYDAITAALGDIQHHIGDDEFNHRRHLTAYGYTYTADGEPVFSDDTLRFIDTGRAILRAASHYEIGDENKIILEYHIQDTYDQTVVEPVAVPLFAILKTGESRDVIEHGLSEYTDNSRCFIKALLTDPEISFYHRSASEQQHLLREKIINELIADISVEYDEDIKINVAATTLYTPGEKDMFIAVPGGIMSGYIRGAIYLEGQREYPKQITSVSDFVSPEQLPSLVIEDIKNRIYYIPLPYITSFSEAASSG